MNSVPRMISSKDLDYISDMLNWNLIASKKTYHFANDSIEEDVTNELKSISNMHKKHYQWLLNLLK